MACGIIGSRRDGGSRSTAFWIASSSCRVGSASRMCGLIPTPLIAPPRGAISFAIVSRTPPVLFVFGLPFGPVRRAQSSRSGYWIAPLPKVGIPTSVARLLSLSAAAKHLRRRRGFGIDQDDDGNVVGRHAAVGRERDVVDLGGLTLRRHDQPGGEQSLARCPRPRGTTRPCCREGRGRAPGRRRSSERLIASSSSRGVVGAETADAGVADRRGPLRASSRFRRRSARSPATGRDSAGSPGRAGASSSSWKPSIGDGAPRRPPARVTPSGIG